MTNIIVPSKPNVKIFPIENIIRNVTKMGLVRPKLVTFLVMSFIGKV